MCDRKIPDIESSEEETWTCGNQECESTMLKSSCRSSLKLTLMFNDTTKNRNVQLFLPNDQSQQLAQIIEMELTNDKNIAKCLLQYPDIINVTFDTTNKTKSKKHYKSYRY